MIGNTNFKIVYVCKDIDFLNGKFWVDFAEENEVGNTFSREKCFNDIISATLFKNELIGRYLKNQ